MNAGSFGQLATRVPNDTDFPERTHRLECLTRVFDGTIYDTLYFDFEQERDAIREYIPIRDRRPSVRWNLCRIATQDSVSLLFGEGRFPTISSPNAATRDGLAAIMAEAGFQAAMIDAAMRGSVGSVALVVRVLKSRVFLEVMDTGYLTPTFDPAAPDTLVKLIERRKFTGAQLRAANYAIDDSDLQTLFWFRREWTPQQEVWFLPCKLRDPAVLTPVVDTSRTVTHDLGFVPAVWVRNLPGGDEIDGACTFRPGIETQIELEYLLSQNGRGLKYSADPMLLIREPSMMDGPIVRSSSATLVMSEKGDAKLLEINGTASTAVLEHARVLRHSILEAIGGSRGDPDRMAAAQSGRALELLHQPLVWLTDKLRGSYGSALLTLARMLVEMSGRIIIRTRDTGVLRLSDGPLSLRWPDWFDASQADRQAEAATLVQLVQAGIMSRETAAAIVARTYRIADVGAEQDAVEAEKVPMK